MIRMTRQNLTPPHTNFFGYHFTAATHKLLQISSHHFQFTAMNFVTVADGRSPEFPGPEEFQNYLQKHIVPEVSCKTLDSTISRVADVARTLF